MADLPLSFDILEESPGFLIWQTTMLWQRRAKRALEEYNISQTQLAIMAILLCFEAHKYDITQILIVKWSKLDKMTVSKALKALDTLGLVKRIEHATDTRAKSISLTDNGIDLVQKLIPIVENVEEEFFGKASPEDQESLIRMLGTLTARYTEG